MNTCSSVYGAWCLRSLPRARTTGKSSAIAGRGLLGSCAVRLLSLRSIDTSCTARCRTSSLDLSRRWTTFDSRYIGDGLCYRDIVQRHSTANSHFKQSSSHVNFDHFSTFRNSQCKTVVLSERSALHVYKIGFIIPGDELLLKLTRITINSPECSGLYHWIVLL